MMGERTVRQESLFCGFSLAAHVPADHLLRSIDRFVELSGIRRQLKPYYSAIGRPSVDPELMIRMLLIGYCCGIRSERRLCQEVHLNIAYRWFCRLDLTDPVPDHSTFSKNRHDRFRDGDWLRKPFEASVRCCMAEGIVGGEGFAVDASMIRADAHRQRGVATPADLDPQRSARAVSEHLAVLDDAASPGSCTHARAGHRAAHAGIRQSQNARTEPSRSTICSTTTKPISIPVRPASSCEPTIAGSPSHEPA
jgi:transposase